MTNPELRDKILRAVSEARRPPSKALVAFTVKEQIREGISEIDRLTDEGMLIQRQEGIQWRLYLTKKGAAALEAK